MGLKITIDIDQLNERKLMPTQYVMLYYLHHNLDCKISPETKNLLNKLGYVNEEGNITSLGRSIFTEPDTISEEKKQDIEELLKKMVEYFPKGKIGGRPLRTAINGELIQKMKKFKKEYKYDSDIILKATQKYSEDKKMDGYKYMRNFKYFIGKQGQGSDLADYCEMIINGETITTNGRNTKTL